MKIRLSLEQRKIVTATTLIILLYTICNRTINRTVWVDPWILKYGTESSGLWYEKVFNEWEKTNPERYRRTLRLTPSIFNELVSLLEPFIRKQNTNFRKSVSPEKRLAITLKYLSTGETFYSLSGQFCVGASTVSEIVKETCHAIVFALKEFTKVPSSPREWKEIADEFFEIWDYPNCVGALDGKHILVLPPPNSGTKFFNYKKSFSTILMALVDAHYRFIFVDVGGEGSVGDASIWNRSALKANIESGTVTFPEDSILPDSTDGVKVPYHIVGDSAFQLDSFLMKPYSQVAVNTDIGKRIFNYRLSRARRCVENAFGILVQRFQVLRAPIRTSIETSDVIVLATISLHNWLMTDRKRRENYCTAGLTDKEDLNNLTFTSGSFRKEPPSNGLLPLAQQGGHKSTNASQKIRDTLCSYFSSDGQRTWQRKMLI